MSLRRRIDHLEILRCTESGPGFDLSNVPIDLLRRMRDAMNAETFPQSLLPDDLEKFHQTLKTAEQARIDC